MNLAEHARAIASHEVYRLSVNAEIDKALIDLGLHHDRVPEAIAFLDANNGAFDSNAYLDKFFVATFTRKPIQTRFSDGNIRVFYSALEPETTQTELKAWILKSPDQYIADRVYFRLFRCQFNGTLVDLIPLVGQYPWLIAEDGYDECNRIAREAVNANLDGFLTQSARLATGRCLPTFKRSALNTVTPEVDYCFTIDRVLSTVEISQIP